MKAEIDLKDFDAQHEQGLKAALVKLKEMFADIPAPLECVASNAGAVKVYEKRFMLLRLKSRCEEAIVRAAGLFDGLFEAWRMTVQESAALTQNRIGKSRLFQLGELRNIDRAQRVAATNADRMGTMLEFLKNRQAAINVATCDDVSDVSDEDITEAIAWLEKLDKWPHVVPEVAMHDNRVRQQARTMLDLKMGSSAVAWMDAVITDGSFRDIDSKSVAINMEQLCWLYNVESYVWGVDSNEGTVYFRASCQQSKLDMIMRMAKQMVRSPQPNLN